ncbi:amino acid ABC transporter ATP-binding protein [Microbacterium betulae]|uniref:Amino acid ABC transporter ATP-binding protein n=1 Tax=Microbacterium betulae TaxID=2981139 RepID=A0AA97I7L2_9MICO|nr:amino acid ABC transporter ATP-binding protein [Microbacterium sp. AB]WOF23747.1 amino acid ABC transporter ATP-binding protein [Microbacterium sp. AB]
MSAAVLRVDDVWKSFGDDVVLRGVDLDVSPGEVVALIGASGSGKSTLLRTINLLEPIDDGQIWLRDLDVSDPRVDADAVRARIGVVFQQYNLFPHLTARQNIALALRHVHGWPKARAGAEALSALARVGLEDKADEHPDRLSGGQQQRVALARAVVSAPELLLLDEITSALDPELVGEVLELVRALADDGATIVMATHEMAFARDVADRVVFLDGGRVVEEGPPARFFGRPREERTRAFLARFSA